MPELPDWFRPVAEYMLREGLPETLRLAAISVTASLVVGVLLGTLMTIRFRPTQWLIRLYVEVWRGLPILVTVLFIYWLPGYDIGSHHVQLNAYMSAALALSLWGSAQVAEATRGAFAVDPEGAARSRVGARLRLGRAGNLRHPPAGLAEAVAADGQPAREHHPEHDDRLRDRRQRVPPVREPAVREPHDADRRRPPIAIFGFVMLVFFVISFPLTRLPRTGEAPRLGRVGPGGLPS